MPKTCRAKTGRFKKCATGAKKEKGARRFTMGWKPAGGSKKTVAVRRRAGVIARRVGINLAADRNWRAKLVPMSRYKKGKNARRFDLGIRRKGRLVRIFD